MTRLLPFALAGVAVGGVLAFDEPQAPVAGHQGVAANAALPIGRWKVEFANGVNETVSVGNGGESSVDEPRRRSMGKAEAKGASIVIVSFDDRIERWTPVGNRYVVEHWFPASRVPVTAPVVGIAERARD